MRQLGIDIETYSSVSLKESGVYPYAESPDFEILLFAYHFDDDPVEVIDLTTEPLPEHIVSALTDPNILKTAWNANFERVCIGQHLGTRMLPEQWECTMVKALTLGLPGSLDKASKVLGFDEDKQKDRLGKALIRYFSVPCKPTKANGGRTRNLPVHDPEKWNQYIEYNRQDVVVEYEIRKKLERYKTLEIEKAYWNLDQDINDRGIGLDLKLVDSAIELDEKIKHTALAEIKEITGAENPNSRQQIKDWVEEQLGYELEKFDKDVLKELFNTLPEGLVKQVIELRLMTTKSSVKKYERMSAYQCKDGRARGTMQFYGASRTGRFSGRGIQLQNLSKNRIPDLKEARECVKNGDLDELNLLYGNIPDLLSQLVRTALLPSEGNEFIVSDFSAIEARVIAWLAGEQWRLDVFKNGGDIYCESASRMFGVPVEKHGVNGHLRQKGKVAELACGYGGSVGALKAFGADKMGLSEEDMRSIISDWRRASPHIVKLWSDVEQAAKTTISTGRTSRLQYGLAFGMVDGNMFIRLPSRRKLCYRKAVILPNRSFGRPGIVYNGIQGDTHGWGQVDTHGGKLVENIVQAIARDCLCVSMKRLDDKGYDIVSHVHDEVILDVPRGTSTPDIVGEIMGEPIDWAPGLKLDADGYTCDFYLKD